MADPVVLQVHCPHCGRPVKLAYIHDGRTIHQQYVWICPYQECLQMDTVSLYGEAPTATTDALRKPKI